MRADAKKPAVQQTVVRKTSVPINGGLGG